MTALSVIYPEWPAPARVKALQTTRHGGVSQGVYASLNLGEHVADAPMHVAANRQRLASLLPSEPVWLNQVHGVQVIDAAQAQCTERADASFTRRPEVVCVTMTADCLPVLLCDQAGSVVAAVHAGWRSLCDGVLEATVAAMTTHVPADQLLAWFGPAIGPHAFEVGSEVRAQFMRHDPAATLGFVPAGEKWLGDLYLLARQRLHAVGVTQIYGGNRCTYSEPEDFFSYRRDGATGRMATLIWLA